jgi:hypothetical protein
LSLFLGAYFYVKLLRSAFEHILGLTLHLVLADQHAGVAG